MSHLFVGNNIEMLKVFVEESIENLKIIEDEIVKWEKHDHCSRYFRTVFDKMHTIKGLSSFFCLPEMTRLGHQAECLLDIICNDSRYLDQTVVQSLLLAIIDALVEMFVYLDKACGNSEHDTVLEVDIQYAPDIEMLTYEIDLLLRQYTEYGDTPSLVEIFQSEQSIEVDEPSIRVDNMAEQMDTGFIDVSFDGLAMGLIEDFLLETDEHSEMISNTLLLKLDINPEDAEALGDLFRRVHSIKGNVGLVLSVPLDEAVRNVFKELLVTFQNMESLLACIRDSKKPISGDIISVCFETFDEVSNTLTTLRNGGIVSHGGHFKELATKMLILTESVKCDISSLATDRVVVALPPLPRKMPAEDSKVVSKGADAAGVSTQHSIRVSGEKIDRLMNIIGEFSMTKNVFSQLARKLSMEYNLPHVAREIKEAGQFVNRISAELEDAIMAMRMTEVRIAFQKFPRIVRDVAMQTGKQISLVMEGEDTQLDKNIIEQIGDPLLHLVRNSCDHGIETLQERQAVGKEAQGTVYLRAYNRGKYVMIEVEDDGRGMNPERLKYKAIEKGFLTEQEAELMSDEQAFQLIFLPGFSTAQNVTEISGRGVGMDVVNSNISALQGTLKIASQLGIGTTITMQLPLTLMVSRGLVVGVQDQLLVIPIDHVVEMVKVSADQLVRRRGKRILYHRGEVLGVVSLADILKMPPKQEFPEYIPIIIVTDGHSTVAMIVDKLLNEQDILLKPLPDYLSGIAGIGGATIMGDGKVALVLNPIELIQLVIRQ